MRNLAFFKNGFARIVMVTATITLIGFVSFQFLDAQDNTEVATRPQESETTQVAVVESAEDIETVTEQLDTTELDEIDAELSAEFNF